MIINALRDWFKATKNKKNTKKTKRKKTKPSLDKRHTLFGTTANTASLCIVAPIRKSAAWLVPKTKHRPRDKRNKPKWWLRNKKKDDDEGELAFNYYMMKLAKCF